MFYWGVLRIRRDFNTVRILIQGFDHLVTKTEEKNKKKICTAEKRVLFEEEKCNLLIPMPPEKPSKLQEKPSALKREHQLQKMKFNNFFLFVCVIFALLDPDPIRIRTWGVHSDICVGSLLVFKFSHIQDVQELISKTPLPPPPPIM